MTPFPPQRFARGRACGLTGLSGFTLSLLPAIAAVAITASPLIAQITVVNTGSEVSPEADDAKTAVFSFDAGGAANKLIVHVSAAGQDVASITYQGVPLTEAVGPVGRNKGIFYLDNPFTGGEADLAVTLAEGESDGIAVAVVSVSGTATGVAATAVSDGGNSVPLPVPVSGSFVVCGYAAAGSGTITLPAGHTAILNSENIGEAHAATSHANGQPAGLQTLAFGDTNPSSPVTLAAAFVPAASVPVITGTSPVSGATAVGPDANLVATFSKPVTAGSGNIELWQNGGGSPIESFDVANSPQISFDGQSLYLDVPGNLAPSTSYHVLIPSTAVLDSGGTPFAGISDPAVWTFTTGSAPPLSPTLSPRNNAFGVALNANLVATFAETIQKGSGNITIHRADGSVFETIAVTSSAVTISGGRVTINPVNDFSPGTGYYVIIPPTALRNTAGQFYPGIADPTTWSFATQPDLNSVDGRLEWSVQQNLSNPWPATTGAAGMASYTLAAMHLGIEVDKANDMINQFHSQFPVKDVDELGFASYFWLHLMWRIYLDPAMNARLTAQSRASIEDMMWRWVRSRSKISDAQGTVWVYNESENHDAMKKGGYLLCAGALKNAPGYGPNLVLADGRTLAEHAAAWSNYFERYFVARAREGINAEIASPIYAKYTVGVYYNVMDFAESPALRVLAERFINLYWADTASDWTLSGVRGGGETRCYKDNYLRLGGQYSFRSLLSCYRWWDTNASVVRTYGLIPATSSYRIPEIITASASDPARPNFLYTSRRWGRAGGTVGKNNFVTFDNGNSFLRRDTWVTPDYTMGTLTFDMNRDYLQIIDQNRAMGVMFASGGNDRVMVFGKGAANNKSYADLSGVTRADCMIVQRDPNVNSSGSGTLVFVPTGLWNNRVETGGWLFLQAGNGYCALRPAGGTYSAASAAHGVDLAMSNIWAPVIVQTGQAANYADFTAFQASVLANPLTFSSNVLNYTSEAGDTFTVYANSKTTPRANGVTVDLNPVKTYDSPYLSMVHGESLATVSHPGHPDLPLDFDPGSTGYIGVAARASRFQSTNSTTNTLSDFTVAPGSHGKLVLAASWESTNGDISATWNGNENFTLAVNRGGGRNSAILYLDNPSPGTGDIVVTYGASVGSRIGVAHFVGAAGGVAATSNAIGRSGSIATPVDNCWVVGVYTSNNQPAITGPFSTTLYNGNSGSSAGDSGYQHEATAGLFNYAWTVSAPSGDNHVLAAFAPVAAVPVLVSTAPAGGAGDVPLGSNLMATFNEPVVAGTGTVTLRRSADDSVVESFDVAISPRISFSGSSITIDPTDNLEPSTGYYVTMDSTAVVNTAGIAFTGLEGQSAWNFNTVGIRVLAQAANAITAETGNTNTIIGFTVAAGSKLVLAASWENPNSGISATWNGNQMFTVAENTAGGRNTAILYLDDPAPGTGNIVVTFAAVTGSRIGVLALTGAAPGVSRITKNTGRVGSINVPADGSLVVGAYTSNNFPTIVGPFTNNLYNGNSGSSAGHAGYQIVPSSGIAEFVWSVSAPSGDNHVLTAFMPAVAGGTFAEWIAAFPGVGDQTGLNDDPDGDGIPNGVENFFGTVPDSFSRGLAAKMVGDNQFVFSHPQGELAADLVHAYRWSTDLLTFHSDGDTHNGTTVHFSHSPDPVVPGTETTVTATISGDPVVRFFVTVEVTER